MKSNLKKIYGWLLIVASIALLGVAFFMLESILLSFVAVVLIIVGVVIKDSSTDEDYNKMDSSIKRISNLHGRSYEKLKEDFLEEETPLGKPRIGQAAWNVKDSLVYGPTAAGEFLYIYCKRGKLYISGIGMESVKNADNLKQAYKFAGDKLVSSGYATVKKYLETGMFEWVEQ